MKQKQKSTVLPFRSQLFAPAISKAFESMRFEKPPGRKYICDERQDQMEKE